jgi:hypothetical protein
MRKTLPYLPIVFITLFLTACGDGEAAETDAEEGGGSPAEVTVTEEEPVGEDSDVNAAELLEDRCTPCHTLDRVYRAAHDEAGWNATLDEMIGYGAKLDSAERTELVAYLVSL